MHALVRVRVRVRVCACVRVSWPRLVEMNGAPQQAIVFVTNHHNRARLRVVVRTSSPYTFTFRRSFYELQRSHPESIVTLDGTLPEFFFEDRFTGQLLGPCALNSVIPLGVSLVSFRPAYNLPHSPPRGLEPSRKRLREESLRCERGSARWRWWKLAVCVRFACHVSLCGTCRSVGPRGVVVGPPYWAGLSRRQWLLRFLLYSWSAAVSEVSGDDA